MTNEQIIMLTIYSIGALQLGFMALVWSQKDKNNRTAKGLVFLAFVSAVLSIAYLWKNSFDFGLWHHLNYGCSFVLSIIFFFANSNGRKALAFQLFCMLNIVAGILYYSFLPIG